jgi:uncharacterized membrane protein (DUF485 family)
MATDTSAAPVQPEAERYVEVQDSPEFGALRKAFRGFVFPVTVAFLLWYGLYVVLSAYARSFMSTKVVGHINVALVFGLLQFVSTFLIAWVYTRWADRRFDPQAERIRAEFQDDSAGGDQS